MISPSWNAAPDSLLPKIAQESCELVIRKFRRDCIRVNRAIQQSRQKLTFKQVIPQRYHPTFPESYFQIPYPGEWLTSH